MNHFRQGPLAADSTCPNNQRHMSRIILHLRPVLDPWPTPDQPLNSSYKDPIALVSKQGLEFPTAAQASFDMRTSPIAAWPQQKNIVHVRNPWSRLESTGLRLMTHQEKTILKTSNQRNRMWSHHQWQVRVPALHGRIRQISCHDVQTIEIRRGREKNPRNPFVIWPDNW